MKGDSTVNGYDDLIPPGMSARELEALETRLDEVEEHLLERPRDLELLSEKRQLLYGLGRILLAFCAAKEIVDHHSDNALGYAAMAQICLDLHLPITGLTYIQDAISVEPDAGVLSILYYMKGSLVDEAFGEEEYEQVIMLADKSVNLVSEPSMTVVPLVLKARTLRYMDDYQGVIEVIGEIRDAIDQEDIINSRFVSFIDYWEVDAMVNYAAKALERMNKVENKYLDLAEEKAGLCAAIYPDDPDFPLMLASVYSMKDDFCSASRILDEALSVFPDDFRLIKEKAKVMVDSGMSEDAVELLKSEAARQDAPDEFVAFAARVIWAFGDEKHFLSLVKETVARSRKNDDGFMYASMLTPMLGIIDDKERKLDELALPKEVPVEQLIAEGESSTLEMKASMRYDYHTGEVNRELQKAVTKTISGFMNYKGGVLVIGVKDDGTIAGIEDDLKILKKPNCDGFELTLRQTISRDLGEPWNHCVRVRFKNIEEKMVCRIDVEQSSSPVYLEEKGNKKSFYVRFGNATKPLDIEEAHDYISRHWETLE